MFPQSIPSKFLYIHYVQNQLFILARWKEGGEGGGGGGGGGERTYLFLS
jgi:hypothetical protein